MDIRRVIIGLTALVLTVGSSGPSGAAVPQRRANGRAVPARIQRPDRAQGNDQDRRVDINNINMWVTNYGSYAWDIATGNSGLVYPRGSLNTAVFASGLWLGAVVNGETRVTVAEYSQEYGPGKMVGGTFDNPNRAAYKTYKVVRWTGDPADSTHLEGDGTYPIDLLIHHSWNEYMKGAVPYGAPWRNYHLPNTSTPSLTDSVDVPGPDVLGDQMLWCVYNDGDPALHTNNAGNTAPMGVEIQQTTFGFNRQGPLGNTVFLKFKIINAGPDALSNMFCSMWADPDLGGFTDDLVGCDTTLSLGYCYNATNDDQQYGGAPPAVGYDFFLGPINKVTGDTLGLVSFNKYVNGTDPGSFDETYNYMQGLLPDGSPLIDPVSGQVTTFFHAGDPVTGAGWLDSNPADRRMLLNSGPFEMAPGDTQTVVGALIIGQGKNRLSSVASLKFFDSFAQAAFDSSFNLPSPPAQPKVDVATDHQQVTLSWDAASRLNYEQPGYKFEGYNVYQALSSSGPWTLLATYDEVDQVRVIFDTQFDVETGQVIPQFPVAFGSDLGVRFNHTVTTDGIRGGPLRDGTDYYFAVTAYSYNPVGKPKVLENPQTFIRAVPQRGAAGTDYATASAATVSYFRKDTGKAPATDVVSVEVVDPNQVTGHIYKVKFDPQIPLFSGQVGQDTATVVNSWSLVDSTTNTVLLSGQLNRRGDDDYRVVDGLRVKVTGQYFLKLQDASYLNNVETNRRALEGVNFGLAAFGGGVGAAVDFLGASSIDPAAQPDSFTTVEFRFNAGAPQKAYRFFRLEKASDGGAPPQGRSYPYGGYFNVAMQAWDTVNNRQLEMAFVERLLTADDGTILPDAQQLATRDSTWKPDASGNGGREYLWVLDREYAGGVPVVPGIGHDGAPVDASIPLMWTVTAKLRTADDVIDDGDALRVLWANPAIPNDIYVFNTAALVRGNTALAGSKLDRIRIVPNPYYSRSRYELSQFNRIMRFVNMPELCTIRIFNLAGDLVRTLHKTDPTSSVLTWDLLTENRLPVASGVYLCHIDVPGVGSTFKKIAVFVEKERLNNF